ncbi:DUF1330 domain-containing protein [Altererythrobacter aquiaggeris]|uniref:DUF1330 domain-containing protein n=1 Tax=Aestuarierythrobacter aquiaggeris TaxID=1898396 RepID=UPI0030190B29
MITPLVALFLQPLSATQMQAPSQPACNQPVVMVVTGTTHDRERMITYARAIAASRLYEELGGYYVNIPAPVAHFEGEAEEGHVTLMVRFPCLENAKAFWYSRVYQEEIRPLRLDPSAGDYIVRVYPEAPLRDDLAGKVGPANYSAEFDASHIEQVAD